MKTKNKKLAKNVNEVMEKCSREVGKWEAEQFSMDLFQECFEGPVDSPIEQILFCGLLTVARLNDLQIPIPLCINPQFEVGKYRVDFLISRTSAKKEGYYEKQVVVECDSQQFHDRTEEERRYEKMRDRSLQRSGYRVFRYTGSEIVKNYMRIAREIITYLFDYAEDELIIDSNIED